MSPVNNRKFLLFSLLLPSVNFFSGRVFAQQVPFFTPGNLVVAVEGCGVHGGTCTSVPNGTGTGSGNSSSGGYGDNQGAPLTLFQFTPNGTASVSYVNSLVLPQTASGANLPVSGEYGSSSEGTLQLSGAGQYLTIGGYGINAATFDAAPATYGAAPSLALAQSGSLTGQSYTAVPRVIALIDPNGNVNSSTAIYNIFNTNNPRSVFTADGVSAYISGQGSGSDATGGVFRVPLGAVTNTPTAITGLDTSGGTLSQDTRDVQIYNGTLYVSVDSKGGSNNARSFVGTLGTPPATSLFSSGAGPTQLTTTNNASTPVAVTSTGKLVLTASEINGINSTGQQINLSPASYFFANASTLYIADTGNPKQNSATSLLGDGGLQKWINTKTDGTGTWRLQYTVAAGLNLVANPNASSPATTTGTTGLYSLTGTVSGGTVYLYATNYTISDLDPTYLYGFADTLAATANPGTSFTQLEAAPKDSNFKGVSFAPTLPAGSAMITSSPSGLAFTSAGTGCAPGSYTTPVTLIWTPGNTCQLSVATPQSSLGTPYVFAQWGDGTTGTTDTVTAPATSATYNASFTNTYQPVGNIDAAFATSTSNATPPVDTISIQGWVADPVDGSPLSNVKVYVDGALVGTPTTGIARPDVASAYKNSAYANSGFQIAATAALGAHTASVVATDSTGRSNTFNLGFTANLSYSAPVGNLDQVSTSILQTGMLSASGWAADPQDGTPLQSLKVYVDGALAGSATQGLSRPDVASSTGHSAYANSGFSFSESAAQLSAGSHSITAIGTDSHGLSTTYGPLPFTVAYNPPVGHLDLAVDAATGSTMVSQSDSIYVSGWAADYHDNGAAKSVQILIDGSPAGSATLGQQRPDVASAYSNAAWGTSGWVLVTPASGLSVGSHSVTAVATDSAGLTTTLGPTTITVQ